MVHKSSGQSLVEMIVVIGVVILLVTGIVSVTTASLSSSKTLQSRTDALAYAQEGIELTRNLRDDGWSAFTALGATSTTYCVGSDGQFIPKGTSCLPNVGTVFTRSITLTLKEPQNPPIDANDVEKMTVDVVVTFADATNPTNSVNLTTYLTQWQ